MPPVVRPDLDDEAAFAALDPDSTAVQELMGYLDQEHAIAETAYSEYFDRLRSYRRAIKAEPTLRMKTFPWPGASNIVVPLIRIAGDAVKARVVNTLLAPQPFWIVNATAPQALSEPFAKPWQNMLAWGAENDIHIDNVVDFMADQIVYFGKCPVKVHWNRDVRKVRAYDWETKKPTFRDRVLADGPLIEPIILENWLEPEGLGESLDKPWNTHRIMYRVAELKQLAAQGIFPKTYDFASLVRATPSELQTADEIRRLSWYNSQIVAINETHVDYDIDGDGLMERLIVKWSRISPFKPLSVRYNYFWHGQKPLGMFFYLRDGQDKSQGDGLVHLLFPLQDSLSTFVNQRTDNITLANTKMWLGKKNLWKRGIQAWPGKYLEAPDPKNDLVPIDMGTISPQSFQHESIVRDYAERLSGISDPQLGREFNNPRVAATTTLSMLQEGNKRFDMIIHSIRVEFARLGTMVSQLYQQFGPRVEPEEVLSPEDAYYVGAILSAPPEMVERHFSLRVNTSSVTKNTEAARQALQQVNEMIQSFYGNVIKITTDLIASPQAPDEVKDLVISITQSAYKLLMEVVKTHELPDPDSILFDPTEMMEAVRDGVEPPPEALPNGGNPGELMGAMVPGGGMAVPPPGGLPAAPPIVGAGIGAANGGPPGGGPGVGGAIPPPAPIVG